MRLLSYHKGLFLFSDWDFVLNLRLTGHLCTIGLSSDRQICLNLLLNNSDLFFLNYTSEIRGWEMPFILTHARMHLLTHMHTHTQHTRVCARARTHPHIWRWVSPFIFRSHWAWAYQIFGSFLPPCSPVNPPCWIEGHNRQKKQSGLKSLHFYSYKYRFRAPCSPPDTKAEWPFDWQPSPLNPNVNEIQKHTSNWHQPAVHQR